MDMQISCTGAYICIYIYIYTHVYTRYAYCVYTYLSLSLYTYIYIHIYVYIYMYFIYGFYHHFNNLHFIVVPKLNEFSIPISSVFFDSSEFLKCRLLKWLLAHPMKIQSKGSNVGVCRNTILSCQPLPSDPAVETALQPSSHVSSSPSPPTVSFHNFMFVFAA